MLIMNIKLEQTELSFLDFSNIDFSDDDELGGLVILKIRNIKNGKIVHNQESFH